MRDAGQRMESYDAMLSKTAEFVDFQNSLKTSQVEQKIYNHKLNLYQ